MKMTASTWAAALLSSLACPAMADFYVGAELGGATAPDFAGQARQTLVNSGYPQASVSQNKGSGYGGIYFGQWVTENFGWETSLVSLTDVAGKIAASNATSTIFTSYRYTAGALTIAAQGAVEIGSAGKLYLKAGGYAGGVTLDGPTSTVSKGSAGPMLGAGYSHQFLRHLSVRVEVAGYFGLRFPNFEYFTPANATTRHNISTLSVGAAYVF